MSPTADSENQLMTLVEAASSILDKRGEGNGLASHSRPTTPTSDASQPAANSSNRASSNASNLGSDKLGSFVEQLMGLLDDDTYKDVVVWMPDGKAFTIVNPKRFTAVEMPKVFNIRNMSSFVRKLTRWGFSRVHDKATMNSDIFMHRHFQRGNKEALSQIKCNVGRPAASVSPSRAKVLKPSEAPPKPSHVPAPTAIPHPHTDHRDMAPPKTIPSSARTASPLHQLPTRLPPPPHALDGLLRGGGLYEGHSLNYAEDMRHLLRTDMRGCGDVIGISRGTANGLDAAIESLLRERESLLKGADANALALVTLLREQELMRNIELRASQAYFPTAGGAAAPPATLMSREELSSLLERHRPQHHGSSLRRVSDYSAGPRLSPY